MHTFMVIIISIIVIWLYTSTAGSRQEDPTPGPGDMVDANSAAFVVVLSVAVYLLINYVPTLALLVRRLKDSDVPGSLAFSIVLIGGYFVGIIPVALAVSLVPPSEAGRRFDARIAVPAWAPFPNYGAPESSLPSALPER